MINILTPLSILGGAVVAAAPYVAASMITKSTHRSARRPAQTRYDPATLPPEIADYFYQGVQELVGSGFTVIDYILSHGPNELITMWTVHLVHRENGDMASMAGIFSTVMGVTKIKTKCLFLTTVFSDGATVVTCGNRVRSGGCFRSRPGGYAVGFSDDVSYTDLYKRHRFLVQKYAPPSPVVFPEPSNEMEAFQRLDDSTRNYQVTRGVLAYDSVSDSYHATWFGAFYMTWAVLWPGKQIRIAKSAARARRALAGYRRNPQ